MDTPHNILVIKLSALGDFIQTLGSMAAIRKHHPNAKITLLTTPTFESFARECGYFDDVWLDDRPRWLNPIKWLSFKSRLNTAKFTRVYDLQNNDRTSLYFKLFNRTQKPEWVGVAKGASHRNTSLRRDYGLAFNWHAQSLKLAGITDIEIDTLKWLKGDVANFDLQTPYVLIVSGSAPQHPQKRWSADNYASLANKLAQEGYQPVLIGTAAEKDATSIIANKCPQALDLTGQTSIAQIATLAQTAAAAIGNDTGPMHIIGVTGCPCLSLFSGGSSPKYHSPLGSNVQTLQSAEIKDLTIDQVYAAFKPR